MRKERTNHNRHLAFWLATSLIAIIAFGFLGVCALGRYEAGADGEAKLVVWMGVAFAGLYGAAVFRIRPR